MMNLGRRPNLFGEVDSQSAQTPRTERAIRFLAVFYALVLTLVGLVFFGFGIWLIVVEFDYDTQVPKSVRDLQDIYGVTFSILGIAAFFRAYFVFHRLMWFRHMLWNSVLHLEVSRQLLQQLDVIQQTSAALVNQDRQVTDSTNSR
jgi:hypothetical protein